MSWLGSWLYPYEIPTTMLSSLLFQAKKRISPFGRSMTGTFNFSYWYVTFGPPCIISIMCDRDKDCLLAVIKRGIFHPKRLNTDFAALFWSCSTRDSEKNCIWAQIIVFVIPLPSTLAPGGLLFNKCPVWEDSDYTEHPNLRLLSI